MSTKIYDAFRMPMPDLVASRTFLEAFRSRATPVFEDLMADRITGLAVAHVDNRACGLSPGRVATEAESHPAFHPTEVPVSWARREVIKRMGRVAATGHRDPQFDLECTVSLVPHVDGYAYMRAFTEQDAYLDIIRSVPSIEPYDYWDSTDGPDGITRKAWKARGKTWAAVLPSGIFSNHGWSTELVGSRVYCLPTLEQLLGKVPPLATRVRGISRNLTFSVWLAAIGKRDGLPIDVWEHGMTYLHDHREWCTGRGAAYLAQVEEIVAGRLRPVLSDSDLRRWGAETTSVADELPAVGMDLVASGESVKDPAAP